MSSDAWVKGAMRACAQIRWEERTFGSVLAGWPLYVKGKEVYAPGLHKFGAIEMWLETLIEPTNDNWLPDELSP